MNETCFGSFQSPLGKLYILFQNDVIQGITFHKPSAKKIPLPNEWITQLGEYFMGKRKSFNLRLSFGNATPFEMSVWNSLREVPYGEKRTYKWLAEKTANPRAARAVGQALKKNPLLIVIPCHRIVESSGSIGGYSAGLTVKRRLQELEYYSAKDATIRQ